MDSSFSSEGAYDAPVDQLPAGGGYNDQADANQLSAERQQRIDRVRQRRSEMAQTPSSVSSALTKTSAPSPVSIPSAAATPVASSGASMRTDLITDAVAFLTNPKVASAPMETKRKFLTQRKGMTESEVDEAVRRATASSSSGSTPASAVMAPPPVAGGAPNYMPQIVYAQPPPMSLAPPPPPSPSLKAIAMVVVLCVGLGGALYQLFKRYILSYWFPKKNALVAKVEALEAQLKSAHEMVTTQASETKEAVSVIRTFLESQIRDWGDRTRLEELRQTQDEQKLSDLKREVSSVRHLLPSVANFGRAVKQSALQTDSMDDIRNELSSLKNAITRFINGDRGSLSLSRAASTAVDTTATSSAPPPATTTATATASTDPAISTPVASAAPSTTLSSSQSGSLSRSRPAWMTAQSAGTPSWQLTDKPAVPTSTTPTPTTETSSSAPAADDATPTAPATTTTATAQESSSAPSETQGTTSPSASADPPYSASYRDILRMVQQGITPPNVKTDVDDTPRDPTAPLQSGSLRKPTKPWQASEGTAQPIAFKVEEADDEDLPKEIGKLDMAHSDEEELVLSDVELV